MGLTFAGATAFNQPLNLWNTSANTNLGKTFNSATSFNQDIKDWDVSNVTYMANMFDGATVFSRDLARWVVGAVPIEDMFKGTPMGTGGDREPKEDSPPLSYFNQAPCFDQDTLILCPTGNICVKDLKEGDKVVTTSGIKDILRIDSKTRHFNNTGNTSTTMYRMKKTGDMTHDLLVTGNHAILLDDLESYKYYDTMKDCSDESKMITGKHSLIAALCNNFEKEMEPKEHTIYHIAIDGDQNRYGLFANGVLMESWDKRQTSM
jgi:surface protein